MRIELRMISVEEILREVVDVLQGKNRIKYIEVRSEAILIHVDMI